MRPHTVAMVSRVRNGFNSKKRINILKDIGMKSAMIDGKNLELTYKTNSGMYTPATFKGRRPANGLSCDVYSAEDGDHIALVLTSVTGDIRNSVTIITTTEYAEIVELYDPYAGGTYHTALLEACGAECHLRVR